MIAVFAILGIFPFGDLTIMTGDTTYQLVDYLSYYKTMIFGDNDFAYSLSKNMGGEMAGFAAYYLLSPLNLLTLPFPRDYLFAGIGAIIVLTPGLASLSMCYTLDHIKKDNGLSLLLSICYGLSAYVIVYNELVYYYTNLILFPLIFLLLRKMISEDTFIKPAYILLLSVAIINNYYTGYMICIFLFIYMIYHLAVIYEGDKRMRVFLRFAVNSVISVCLSGITLIPAIMSLPGEKDNLAVGLYMSFPPFAYFSKLYTGSFVGDFGAGMPNIYCGVIVTVMLFFVIINSSVSIKKRIGISVMLVFFWADFCINTLNVIWHGLNQPIGFPYRQAFVVILFCIITVYENTDREYLPDIKVTAVIILLFAAYSSYILIRKIDNTGTISILVTAAVLILLITAFRLPTKYRMPVLFVVTLLDLSFNAGYSLSHFYPTSVSEYQEPLSLVEEAVGHVKERGDDDIYRMEKLFRRTNNDAMMLDYAGLTHFSSSEKKQTMEYMGSLGFRNNGNWAMYTGINTALSDTILGVRYMLSQFDSTGKPYEHVYSDEEGEYYIYHNTHAIPLMSAVSSDVLGLKMTEDPFYNQNSIAGAMAGGEETILNPQEAARIDNEDGSVSFDIEIKNDGILYCYFSAPEVQDVTLYLDGEEWTDYFRTYNWATVDLQGRKTGDKVRIDLRSNTEEPVTVDEGYFTVIDHEALIDWSRKIRSDKTVLYKRRSSRYEGYYDSDRGTLLFSIPKDKGWHLYIEGKEYELEEACGHMMGAGVPAGKHNVELVFIPPGRYAGCILSVVTLLILVIYCGVNVNKYNILGIGKNKKKH